MKFWLTATLFTLLSSVIFSQDSEESIAYHHQRILNNHVFSFMVNGGVSFYTAKDERVNNFLNKYGYIPPQNFPMAAQLEVSVLPSQSKMVYAIQAATVVSRQDLITADILIGAFRRLFETRNLWVLGGVALGEHFDRIVLDKNLPPSFDSLAQQYQNTLSLHRIGFTAEPTAKAYWYPLQTKKFQAGIFTALAYDIDLNGRWRLGYYPQDSNRFKRLRKPSGVGTKHEYGWVLSGGISIGF